MAEPLLKAKPIVRALHAAFCRDADRQELLDMAATRIRETGSPYSGVYMYMLTQDDVLKLEALSGRPTEHTEIPVGHGICGRAVADATDITVSDVAEDPDYLACSIETKSELVVLIRRNEEILGQIDVDSDVLDGFDSAEHTAVKAIADALAALL